MTGPLWLLVLGSGGGALWVAGPHMVAWRRNRRCITAVARDARAVLAAMGRHSRDKANDRTEPFPALEKAMALMETEFAQEETDAVPRITVAELVARIASEGRPIRLAWKEEDELRATAVAGARWAGDFPTAVLPRVNEESSDTKES
jgi:hypothetical protein